MKMKYVIIGVIVIVIGIFCFIKFSRKNYVDFSESEIKSFHLSYSNGYMMNANIIYEFKLEDDRYIASIKPYLVADENTLIIDIDQDIVEKIVDILKKYEVNKWDGFDKVDKDVLDGDSFSLSVWFKDDKSIHASGYMMWPENYRNVRDEISDIFMEIYNKEKGLE